MTLITLPQPWRSLAYKVGGVGLLAKRLNVSRQVIYNWANGADCPTLPRQEALTTLFAHYGLDIPSFERLPLLCPHCGTAVKE